MKRRVSRQVLLETIGRAVIAWKEATENVHELRALGFRGSDVWKGAMLRKRDTRKRLGHLAAELRARNLEPDAPPTPKFGKRSSNSSATTDQKEEPHAE